MQKDSADEIKAANSAFMAQVSAQVARAATELERLEQLLKAGLVDRTALSDFREAVGKVRNTSWVVQQWLDCSSGESPSSLGLRLFEERLRVGAQLCSQLAGELRVHNATASQEAVRALQLSVAALLRELERVRRAPSQ